MIVSAVLSFALIIAQVYVLSLNLGRVGVSACRFGPVRRATAVKTTEEPALEVSENVLVLEEDTRDKVARLIQQATLYNQKGYYREALAKAQEAVRLDPENRDGLSALIMARHRAEDLQTPEDMLKQAHAYFLSGQYAAAVRTYQNLPQRTPLVQSQILKCYHNLGVFAMKEGRCNLAADYFRQVLFIEEEDSAAQAGLQLADRCRQSAVYDLDFRMQVALLDFRE